MAYTTLNSLLKAIAEAIRNKKGTTAKINAQNFPSEINSILKGSGNASPSDVLSDKTFTNDSGEQKGTIPIRQNGTNTVSSGIDSVGPYFYIPYGYYPEYGNGNAWVRSDFSQITNLVNIHSATLLFNQGNGEGNATTYRNTTYRKTLLVASARGEWNVSGSYGGYFNLNAGNIGVGIYNARIYYDVQPGVVFTNNAFNPSLNNGGLIVWELNY